MLSCSGRFPWTALSVGPMVAGRHGELVAGESDRCGHLYVYYPEPRWAVTTLAATTGHS